jgi:hypothetical protein
VAGEGGPTTPAVEKRGPMTVTWVVVGPVAPAAGKGSLVAAMWVVGGLAGGPVVSEVRPHAGKRAGWSRLLCSSAK